MSKCPQLSCDWKAGRVTLAGVTLRRDPPLLREIRQIAVRPRRRRAAVPYTHHRLLVDATFMDGTYQNRMYAAALN